MIFFLIQVLTSLGVQVPSVFAYSSTRMVLAALTALLLGIFVGPFFIRKLYELKIGQPILVDLSKLHQKKQDTPTMGGVLMLFSMGASLLIWMDLQHAFTLILFVTTLWLGLVGGYDDYLKLKRKSSKGLSGKRKLFWQIALSLVLSLYFFVPAVQEMCHCGSWFAPPTGLTAAIHELYIPFDKHPFLISAFFLVPLFSFVITGTSNAVNLTDGLDGLAAGLLIMVASLFAGIAFLSSHTDLAVYLNILYIDGSSEIAVYLSAFVGACVGFLWYNGYPAQVFMGDVGSISLGGILGVSAVLLRREFLLAIVGGVFVAEAVSVILQVGSYKLRNKKRVLLCAPLHHHFEYKAWPETKVVLRFWIVGLLLAIIGLASLKFQ